MAAVAAAPKEPTMAASMYCMAMELISARMAGTLRRMTSETCWRKVGAAAGPRYWPQSIVFVMTESPSFVV